MIQKQDRKLSSLGFKPKWNKEGMSEEIKFHLTDNILGWGNYYVDTLMENAEGFIRNKVLCVDGGSDTCILNMNEFVRFVLKNRYHIEMELRN